MPWGRSRFYCFYETRLVKNRKKMGILFEAFVSVFRLSRAVIHLMFRSSRFDILACFTLVLPSGFWFGSVRRNRWEENRITHDELSRPQPGSCCIHHHDACRKKQKRVDFIYYYQLNNLRAWLVIHYPKLYQTNSVVPALRSIDVNPLGRCRLPASTRYFIIARGFESVRCDT